jgi:hypothetical protein
MLLLALAAIVGAEPTADPGALGLAVPFTDDKHAPAAATAPPPLPPSSEKGAELAQNLGRLQPFMAVFPLQCMGQLASFGPT